MSGSVENPDANEIHSQLANRRVDVRTDREFRCDDCRNRCTVSVNEEWEWGHKIDCDNREVPDTVPTGDASGNNRMEDA